MHVMCIAAPHSWNTSYIWWFYTLRTLLFQYRLSNFEDKTQVSQFPSQLKLNKWPRLHESDRSRKIYPGARTQGNRLHVWLWLLLLSVVPSFDSDRHHRQGWAGRMPDKEVALVPAAAAISVKFQCRRCRQPFPPQASSVVWSWTLSL